MPAANGYRVGVVGATGAVGSTILEVLAERDFPAREVVPLTSARSAGQLVAFNGSELRCVELTDDSLGEIDIAISSAGGAVSAEWAPKLVEAGAVVVDNTSFWRMHEDVPLVVTEVNPEAIASHNGIIANPNCSTMQMVVALAPIHRAAGIERIVVSTYQSVSGTGRRAVEELLAQSRAVLADEPAVAEVYPHQIAFNVIPQVESFKDGDDYTTEERKMMAETRKILEAGDRARHLRHVRSGAGHRRPLRVREHPDPRRPRSRRVPRAARDRPRRDAAGLARGGHLPDDDPGRRS